MEFVLLMLVCSHRSWLPINILPLWRRRLGRVGRMGLGLGSPMEITTRTKVGTTRVVITDYLNAASITYRPPPKNSFDKETLFMLSAKKLSKHHFFLLHQIVLKTNIRFEIQLDMSRYWSVSTNPVAEDKPTKTITVKQSTIRKDIPTCSCKDPSGQTTINTVALMKKELSIAVGKTINRVIRGTETHEPIQIGIH